MAQVPRKPTPISEVELAVALRSAYIQVFGVPPSKEMLGCGWAQVALEHKRGEELWNNCFGNVTASTDWKGDYYVFRCAERVDKKNNTWKVIDMKFRAYPTAAEGAVGYWNVLRKVRYSAVLPVFEQGKAREAALLLGEKGYYTAHEDVYSNTMSKLYDYFQKQVLGLLPPLEDLGAISRCDPDKDEACEIRSVLSEEDIRKIEYAQMLLRNDMLEDLEPVVDEADDKPLEVPQLWWEALLRQLWSFARRLFGRPI